MADSTQQHDGDAIAAMKSERKKACGGFTRTGVELAVADDALLLVAKPQADVGSGYPWLDMNGESLK